MSKDPRKDIMKRYSQRTMASNTAACHYDNLREHGYPRDEARRIAKEAADNTHRSLDGQADALAAKGNGKAAGADESPSKGTAPVHSWLRWSDE